MISIAFLLLAGLCGVGFVGSLLFARTAINEISALILLLSCIVCLAAAAISHHLTRLRTEIREAHEEIAELLVPASASNSSAAQSSKRRLDPEEIDSMRNWAQ